MGCRERAAKTDLLRIVMAEGEGAEGSGKGVRLVPDPRGTLPGRGAYVHPALVCLDMAVRRRAFLRAYRVRGPLDTTDLSRYVEQAQP